MFKIDKYKAAKALFYFLHIYLLFQIYFQYNSYDIKWDILYLPTIFSVIISIFTYMIYTQSNKKTGHLLIYFLLTGSVAYFTAFLQSTGIYVTIILFTISFQLSGWYFNKFVTETLFYRRISYRRNNKTEKVNVYLLIMIICLETYAALFMQESVLAEIIVTIYIIYFLGNMFIPLFKIVYALFHSKRQEKSFLRWMLIIPLFSFGPFLFLHVLPYLFQKPYVDPLITTWTFFAIPVGYTYLILAKRLLDLGVILNRFLYYLFLALIPSFLIALSLIWFSPAINLLHFFQLLGILLFFNAIFLILKEQIDYYFRYALFQDKNNVIQRIEQLQKDLKKILNLSDLNDYVAQGIRNMIRSVEATIVKYNTETNHIEREYLIGTADFEQISFKDLYTERDQIMIDSGKSIGFFLSYQSNTIHYLWIRKSKRPMHFRIFEKSWLLIFISYIRLTYENILLNEAYVTKITESDFELSSSQSRFLFHIAETERRRIADNIHNTILQDQIYIYRELDTLAEEKCPELKPLKKEFKKVIDRTRETYTEIIPNTLFNRGLASSLDKLLHQWQQKVSFRLDYEIELTTDKFDYYERSLIIYRVVEELVNNAIKHSEAGRVSIYIWEAEKNLYIDYLDNGKGFDEKKALEKKQIGLQSMIERIKSLNGMIEFNTSTPRNVLIYITIPE